MAFRATSQIKADGYSEAKRLALSMKNYAQSHHDALAAGNVSANAIIFNLLQEFKSAIEKWDSIAAIPGINAYAQDQEDDANYNIGAEFTAMVSAAEAVRDRIVAEMPKATQPPGVAGRIAVHTLAADGSISVTSFTPAQTASLRTDLTAFIATIT
jgi:hypothetical protein